MSRSSLPFLFIRELLAPKSFWIPLCQYLFFPYLDGMGFCMLGKCGYHVPIWFHVDYYSWWTSYIYCLSKTITNRENTTLTIFKYPPFEAIQFSVLRPCFPCSRYPFPWPSNHTLGLVWCWYHFWLPLFEELFGVQLYFDPQPLFLRFFPVICFPFFWIKELVLNLNFYN